MKFPVKLPADKSAAEIPVIVYGKFVPDPTQVVVSVKVTDCPSFILPELGDRLIVYDFMFTSSIIVWALTESILVIPTNAVPPPASPGINLLFALSQTNDCPFVGAEVVISTSDKSPILSTSSTIGCFTPALVDSFFSLPVLASTSNFIVFPP